MAVSRPHPWASGPGPTPATKSVKIYMDFRSESRYSLNARGHVPPQSFTPPTFVLSWVRGNIGIFFRVGRTAEA